MGLFDKQDDINEEEVERLKAEKVKLQQEYDKVKEYMILKQEVENAKQSIKNLKQGVKVSNSNAPKVGNAIKDTFSALGGVLGEMASNSKANEEKKIKQKKNEV